MRPLSRILSVVSSVCLLAASSLHAITITVAKSGADCTTITAAINAAQPGDVIKIVDLATYEEQVTIDSSKYPLTLTSKDPAALAKPTIKYRDTIHVGPKTAAEAGIDSLITFDQNGAIRILLARNVIIDGIAVDGGGVFPFGYPSIWEGRYGFQHGNAAITVWQSGGVIIRNCDISNSYFGINFKDRNVEGIFSNPIPVDGDTDTYVPPLGFGKTGNHLVERNRIHNNSWGMFFESCWDLGSTIRCNLIYENHHANDSIAKAVKNLTSDDGLNQPGGAFLFKDNILSPLAIYNNTLYRNFALFAGHWQAGYQHLVFNNLFGPPYKYWSDTLTKFSTNTMELTPMLINRVFSCIYSAQIQAPVPQYVRIMEKIPQVEGEGGTAPAPGTLLTGTSALSGFPAASNNRWIEMDSSLFLSLNPASPNFLEPNWASDIVKQFIARQGWENSGVTNTDGTRADLGAIEQARGMPASSATIQPGPLPIMLDGTNAQVSFSLDRCAGSTVVDPRIKLFRLVKVPYKTQSFGSNDKTMIISASSMTDVSVPTTPSVKVGRNTYGFSANITTEFAFIEMIIEAAGADGKRFTTPVGFLPYRKLDYTFKVEIADKATETPLTETRIGDTVLLKLSPQKINGEAISNHLSTVRVALQSGAKLLTPGNPPQSVAFPNGVTGPMEKLVIFTNIPENGLEFISVAGFRRDSPTGSPASFFGGAAITVLPAVTALAVDKSPLTSNRAFFQSKETTISCFDLSGRRIFQRTFSADMDPALIPHYVLKTMPAVSSKVYLLDISVKDRISLKQTINVRKILAR